MREWEWVNEVMNGEEYEVIGEGMKRDKGVREDE